MKRSAVVTWVAACGIALLLVATAIAADEPTSNVGRRYPSEIRTFVDKVTGLPIAALTNSSFNDAKPYQTHTTWTSDGEWIIFRSNRGGNGSQAFVVHETTGDIIQLTDGERTATGSLNLSRKSMKLYYMRGGRQFRRRREQSGTPPPRQLVELDIKALISDSMAGQVQEPTSYERVVATLPDDLRDSGGFALDADETKAYWGCAPIRPRRDTDSDGSEPGADRRGRIPERGELLRRNTDVNETRDQRRARFEVAGRGSGRIVSIDLSTGELATVIDLDFRLGHVQSNPWKSGEIVYCHETGGDAPQRMWVVNADGSNNHPLYVETPGEWITHETFATQDEVMFLIIGHLPDLREKPTGIAAINLRNNQMKILGQIEEEMGQGRRGGFWHCNGSPDGRWAVGDTFGGNIHVIDRTSGEITLLTTDHKMRPDHAHPIFSPDSRRVLIQSGLQSDGANLDLMVVTLPDELW